MAKMPLLNELTADWLNLPESVAEERIAALMAAADDEKRTLGIMLKAALAEQRSGPMAAALVLKQARRLLGCMPLPVIYNYIDLCRRMHREQDAAHACMDFAGDAVGMGYVDVGLEAASAAIVLDSKGEFNILKTPAKLLQLAGVYERAAGALPALEPAALSPGPPWRVALVVSNIVDHVVAHTKTALHFARYADREKYALSLFSSENLSGRRHPQFPFGCAHFHSEQTGENSIREMRRLGVPVTLMPRDATFTQTAALLSRALTEAGTHFAVFQSGFASPIDWLAARLAPVPVKAAIHIGCSLFNSGIAVTFFDNPANIERETPFWPASAGEREVRPLGVDIDELDRLKPLDRGRFGLPEDALIFGCLSNHLDKRMSAPFIQVVADALVAHPKAWFVAFGQGELQEQRAFFQARGLDARVVFAGPQLVSGSALKLLDVYVNEFPVGGCVAALEAMACGVPVVAMRAGPAHAESAAAEAVGRQYAVSSYDPAAYSRLLGHWLKDPAARNQAAMQMRAKAAQKHHVRDYVAGVLETCERFYPK